MLIIEESEYIEDINRDAILIELREIWDELRDKISNGRIKDKEAEKLRIQYYKSVISLANTFNQLLKDKQIDELKQDLLILREAMNNPSSTVIIDKEPTEKLIAKIKGL